MSRLIKNIAVFIFLGIGLYLVVLVCWGEFMPAIFKKNVNYSLGAYGHMYTRSREATGYGKVDILFIGSSHAYRGFDTRIAKEYGYESFNLGSSAQTPVQTKLLLNRYLDKLQPKILVYEVCPEIFMNDGVESSLDMIANTTIDANTIKMVFSINNIKIYNSLLYGYYRQLFGRDKNFTEKPVILLDTYIPGGFVERSMEKDTTAVIEDTNIAWQPKTYQLSAFHDLLATVKQRNIRLVLVQSPVTKKKYLKRSDNSIMDGLFSARGEYYNFNELLRLSDSLDFYNEDHLNQKGVIVFNRALLDKVGVKR